MGTCHAPLSLPLRRGRERLGMLQLSSGHGAGIHQNRWTWTTAPIPFPVQEVPQDSGTGPKSTLPSPTAKGCWTVRDAARHADGSLRGETPGGGGVNLSTNPGRLPQEPQPERENHGLCPGYTAPTPCPAAGLFFCFYSSSQLFP